MSSQLVDEIGSTTSEDLEACDDFIMVSQAYMKLAEAKYARDFLERLSEFQASVVMNKRILEVNAKLPAKDHSSLPKGMYDLVREWRELKGVYEKLTKDPENPDDFDDDDDKCEPVVKRSKEV